MDLRVQQSNGRLSEHGTASARNFYQLAHSPRRDHDTTSACVNIIGRVITSASSDRTSNTIATEFGTTFEIFEARGGAVTMKVISFSQQ
ncbi:hypothetical protein Tco_1539043 [Tanacetum coccineum]